MGTIRKIAKLFLQYIGGFIFAWGVGFFVGVVGSLCLMWYCKVFLPPPTSPHTFGDLYGDFIGGGGYLFSIFVCVPIGGTFGILMVDNLISKHCKTFLLKTIISLAIAILSSAVIFWFWAMSCTLQYSEIRTLSFIVVCIPIGETLGILIADKLILKHHKVFLIIISLLMGILGSAFVYLVFPLLDIDTALLYRYLPFLGINTEGWLSPISTCPIYSFLSWGGDEAFFLISTLFALIGYNIVGLFAHKQKSV